VLCAPSMGEGIERYRIIPEGVNPLQASWRSLLVSRNVVCCEASTEGSETTKSGTDPDKDRGRLNRNGIQRLIEVDK